MKAIIDAVVGIAMLLTIGSGTVSAYRWVRTQALQKAHQGLPRLEPFTRKLTGGKLDY